MLQFCDQNMAEMFWAKAVAPQSEWITQGIPSRVGAWSTSAKSYSCGVHDYRLTPCGSKVMRRRVPVATARRSRVWVEGRVRPPSSRATTD